MIAAGDTRKGLLLCSGHVYRRVVAAGGDVLKQERLIENDKV